MTKNASSSSSKPEKATDAFGALGRLPSATFRGIEGELLAEQYRRFRALEQVIKPRTDEPPNVTHPQHSAKQAKTFR